MSRIKGNKVNTYTFTKALAESYIAKHGQGMPVAIFRPSVVCNSAKEPVAGWVDAVHGAAGSMLAVAHGALRNAWLDPLSPHYLIPVDFCANLMLAIGWEVGTERQRLVQELELECVEPDSNIISLDESYIVSYCPYVLRWTSFGASLAVKEKLNIKSLFLFVG